MGAKSGFTQLGIIKRWIKESTDLDHYDLMFALQLFMAGDKGTIDLAMKGKILEESNRAGAYGGELPDYGEIMPGIGQIGTQNHGLINAKINIEGLSMEPEFVFAHPDPLIRQVNAAYIRDLWVSQGWDASIFMAGMEMEANGIGSVHWGVTDARPNIRHSPNLDTLWDRSRREPSRWGWVCVRNRLSPEETEDIYGDALTDAELRCLTEDEPEIRRGDNLRQRRQRRKQVVEWSWYSRDEHVVWLGGIHGGTHIPLKLDKRYEYVKCGSGDTPNADNWDAGPNPFGVIPHSFWLDFWSPGVNRPTSKMETTMRLATMLNEVERYIVNTLRYGIALTSIDSTRIDKDLLERLKGATSFEGISQILLVEGGSIADVMHRLPATELPAVALQLRSILKDEINAATGVGDMQRGQALGGERRTRFEVNALLDQSGVQARFERKEFGNFLRDMVNVCRTIGASQDEGNRTLSLPDMDPIDLRLFPIKPYLEINLPVEVDPNSLTFKTEEDRRQEAIIDLQQVHTPFIEMGVADPAKVMIETYKKLGYQNPQKRFGRDPLPIAQQVSAQAGAPGATPAPLEQPQAPA